MRTEITQETKDKYSNWTTMVRKLEDDFKNRKISMKRLAEELTTANCEYNGDDIRNFSIDDVYNEKKEKYVILKLTIVFNKEDAVSLEKLILQFNEKGFGLSENDGEIYLSNLIRLDRKLVKEKIIEERLGIEIIDYTKTHGKTLNIPRFQFLMKLAGLDTLFGVNGVPSVVSPFHKFEHGIYCALNNAAQIYVVRRKNKAHFSSNIKPKYYAELNEVFRSSWEAFIAKILNQKEIKWEYEKEGYLLNSDYLVKTYGYNSYNPDFFFDNNHIIEIKGFWDEHSLMKVNLFKEQYTNHRLYIIDQDMMYSLYKMYNSIVQEVQLNKIVLSKQIVPIVGITRGERRKAVSKVKLNDKLLLERDSKNPYDPNAIKVLNKEKELIGYIAKEWATIYSEKIDIGMKFDVIVETIEDKVINVLLLRSNIDNHIVYDFLEL